jgi:hypothetical protein
MMSISCSVRKGEEFRDLPGFEGFIAVSNHGRVYTYPRVVEKLCGFSGEIVRQSYKGRLLKQHNDGNGYKRFSFGVNGKRHQMLVSRAVLMAFVGASKPGQFACHNDSDPFNNMLENLRWDDQKGNMKDRMDRGLYAKGEAHHAVKVPVELVDRLQSGTVTAAQAARETGFRYVNLWRIAKGHSWKHRTR